MARSAAYRLLPSPQKGVIRTADMALIPENARNRDWVAYQAWLAVPNTPDRALVRVPPTRISAADFFYRFTDEEKVLVQAACNTTPALGVGLTHGLALGYIDLDSAVVSTWLDGMVSAEAITTERKAVLLTP